MKLNLKSHTIVHCLCTILLFSCHLARSQDREPAIETKSSYLLKEENNLEDSLEKIQMHGISIEIVGKNLYYYNTGYEFISRKNNNSFGFSTNLSYHPGKAYGYNGRVLYSNLFFGGSFIYEFGKKWGFRSSLNLGASIIPEMYSDKFDRAQVLPVDDPNYYSLLPAIGVGPFYRTKNYRWQFTPQFYLFYVITKGSSFKGDYYTKTFVPWFGINVKYNFKTHPSCA